MARATALVCALMRSRQRPSTTRQSQRGDFTSRKSIITVWQAHVSAFTGNISSHHVWAVPAWLERCTEQRVVRTQRYTFVFGPASSVITTPRPSIHTLLRVQRPEYHNDGSGVPEFLAAVPSSQNPPSRLSHHPADTVKASTSPVLLNALPKAVTQQNPAQRSGLEMGQRSAMARPPADEPCSF